MTWLLITAPFMLIAVAIAVLPVLLISIREARNESRRQAIEAPVPSQFASAGALDDRSRRAA